MFTIASLSALRAGVIPTEAVNEITLLIRSDRALALKTRATLETELRLLLAPARVVPTIRDLDAKASARQFQELVVVTLNGPCQIEMQSRRRFTTGALASAHSTDGQVLPFIEVACDRISDTMWPALRGADFKRLPELFGRAMARVLAHELYHVLARTKEHGYSPLTSKTLNGQQLLAEQVQFEETDLEKISAGGGA